MKKKLFVGTIVPSVAALSVIGSGFALWIFDNNTVANESGNVQIEVTDAAEIGEIVKSYSSELVFDQPSSTSNSKGKGVYFTGEAKWGNKSQYYTNCLSGVYKFSDDKNEISDDKTDLVFTVSIKLGDKISKYVNIDFTNWTHYYGNGLTINHKDDVFSYTFKYSDYGSNWIHNDGSYDLFYLYDFQYFVPSYIKTPSTLDEYKAMVEDVKGEKITVESKVQLISAE